MVNLNWDRQKLRLLAQESGRPFEVQCALKLLAEKWFPELGSYYVDLTTNVTREIDVLAGQTTKHDTAVGEVFCHYQVAISCKGFPTDCMPVTYSIAASTLPSSVPPRFPTRAKRDRLTPSLEGAQLFLEAANLGRRRVISFDVVRSKTLGKGKAQRIEYERIRDKDYLHLGMDSAIKAAIWWSELPLTSNHFGIYVPVLLLPSPWLDVPVDSGVAGDPVEVSRACRTLTLPIGGGNVGPDSVTCLIWSLTDLDGLLAQLGNLRNWWFKVVLSQCRKSL